LAGQTGEAVRVGLDVFAPLFASRQKVEMTETVRRKTKNKEIKKQC
jgi:hypothetical protein